MIKLFDGAMGTMLQKSGLKPGACPEMMNLENPDAVTKIHLAYLKAGAHFLTTNTFGATALKLEHYGLSGRYAEINAAAVKAAKNAVDLFVEEAGDDGRGIETNEAIIHIDDLTINIAGDIGPLGRFIAPLGDLGFEAAYKNFYEQAKVLIESGVDCLIVETMIEMNEMRAAVIAAKDAMRDLNKKIPLIAQFTYAPDGRTVTGTDPATAAVTLDALGVDVIGANCSLGPREYVAVVKEIAKVTDKTIIIQPNAGMPLLKDKQTVFPMDAVDFAAAAKDLVAAGAGILGGCCGTDPEFIRAVALAVKDLPPKARKPVPKTLNLTSRTRTVTIGGGRPPVFIGERINPTGKKKMAAAIKAKIFAPLKQEALAQQKNGASVLDVNLGVGGIDEAEAFKGAVDEITAVCDLPLAIDTADAAALEAALRVYPGRALINSVSAEPERLAKFLPLAKKYGAAIIVLPLKRELPKTAAERVETVREIIAAARSHGLKDGDFLLDALVMTLASDSDAAAEVIKAVAAYKNEFGYPVTMGLSNVSFGLPERKVINRVFLAVCLAQGLDAPIINVNEETVQETLAAAKAILGFDKNGVEYSKVMAAKTASAAPARTADDAVKRGDVFSAVKQAVKDGNKEGVTALLDAALNEGKGVNEITEAALTKAMDEIGVGFKNGTVFLPQVMMAAEVMKTAFDYLKRKLSKNAGESLGNFVIATVKGDVHDLGKNIVAALLSNSGFNVIDLGKDVDAAAVVKAAQDNKAAVVGLCALMTTTMPELDTTVAALRAANVNVPVIIGGAAVTNDYLSVCHADYYADDAVDAVNIAKKIVQV